MGRDLLAGGIFFGGVTFAAFVLSCALPLWWFTTVELEGQQCNCGTGLWRSNYTWGDPLREKDLFSDVQCSATSAAATKGCSAAYGADADATKSKGHTTGVLSVISMFFLSLAFLKAFRASSGKSAFQRDCLQSAVCMLMAVVLQLVGIVIFMSAPLFDNLGNDFSCKFTFAHAINSNYLTCHALGPSFGLAVGGCLSGLIATILLFLAHRSPRYIMPHTGRYSLYHVYSQGARPLDITGAAVGDEGDEYVVLNAETVEHETVGAWLRVYYIPLLLLSNIALFIWSNCSTGATVEPSVQITFPHRIAWIIRGILPHRVDHNGVLSLRDDVFNFTLITSLRHFWEGRAYGLAVLIGVFSGAWPYVKLLTMLVLWFVPATEKLRGKLLHWLDVLGKWSLIDAYVLCLMAVAFGFKADKEILGIDIKIDIKVRPGWGVYSFVIATMCSLLLSHHITSIHRSIMDQRNETEELTKAMSQPPLESLSYRAYAPFPKRRRFACTSVGRIALWLLLLVTFIITLTGQLVNTFRFKFSGLVELVLDEAARDKAYSLVSNGVLLPAAASEGGFLSGGNWAYFITVMYFLFAMIVPLLTLLSLGVLWSFPFTLQTTRKAFRVCQFLQAWAALDVFLVSIVAACLEIGGLSSAVIGDAFSGIQDDVCKLLKEIPPWLLNDILRAVDLEPIDLTTCSLFRVDAELVEGCYLLVFAVCMWGIITHLIMEYADASISERILIARVLSAQSYDQDDPYELLRMRANDTPSESLLSPLLESTMNQEDVSSVYVKEIIAAQEKGARRFMGTYFGDCMYGPFPRTWWVMLCRMNVLQRVPWEELSYSVHSRLLLNLFNYNEG